MPGLVQGLCTLDDTPDPGFPHLALVVSGGHTSLVKVHESWNLELIGATRDDAAGEAFDKVAKMLGLPYPGGPSIAAAAQHGDGNAFNLPKMNQNKLKLWMEYF